MLEFENCLAKVYLLKSKNHHLNTTTTTNKNVKRGEHNKLLLWHFLSSFSFSHFISLYIHIKEYIATMETKPTIISYAISLYSTTTIVFHRITTGQLTSTHIAFSFSFTFNSNKMKTATTKRACSIGLLLGYGCILYMYVCAFECKYVYLCERRPFSCIQKHRDWISVWLQANGTYN